MAMSRNVVSLPPAMVMRPSWPTTIWCSRLTFDSLTSPSPSPSAEGGAISGRNPAHVAMTSARAT